MRRSLLLATLVVGAWGTPAVADVDPAAAGGSIYLKGERTGAGTVRARVLGDVSVSGQEAACVGCHQRSGLGTFEGPAAAPPVAARFLFSARTSGGRARKGYTPELLARALREGIDPEGRPLDPLMPRYDLSEGEVGSLAAYLSGLSAHPSPGVDDRAFHLATVVTPDADPAVRERTVAVLKAFAEVRSHRTRNQGRMGKRRSDNAFREWDLKVWALTGPPEGWGAQLEAFYDRQPVFALLSGAGGRDWSPVHKFCERHRIPSILPNLDVPPDEAGSGFYNLYFSRGVLLEADAIAASVAASEGRRVVQVIGGGAAAAAGRSLALALSKRGVTVTREAPDTLPHADLSGATDVVLWLSRPELKAVRGDLPRLVPTARVYLSSHLLGPDEVPELPAPIAAHAVVARPFCLPDEVTARYRRVGLWLGSLRLPGGDRRIDDQTYTACQVLGEAISDAGFEYQRDYVLEMMDHEGGLEQISSFYPRLSFGPEARILARGCYLVPLGAEAGAPRWLVP